MCSKKLKMVVCVTAIFLSLSVLTVNAEVDTMWKKLYVVPEDPILALTGHCEITSENEDDPPGYYNLTLKNCTISRNNTYGFTNYIWYPFSDPTYPHSSDGDTRAFISFNFEDQGPYLFQGYNTLRRLELTFRFYAHGCDTQVLACNFYDASESDKGITVYKTGFIPASQQGGEQYINYWNLYTAYDTSSYFGFDLLFSGTDMDSNTPLIFTVYDSSCIWLSNSLFDFDSNVDYVKGESEDFRDKVDEMLNSISAPAISLDGKYNYSGIGILANYIRTDSLSYELWVLLASACLTFALVGYILHGKKG